jgi:transposase
MSTAHLSEEAIDAAAMREPTPHAIDCAACAARVRAARGRQRLLASLQAPAPLTDIAVRRVEARVMAAVAEPPWPWWARLGPLSLVAVSLALAVWFWPPPAPTRTRTVAPLAVSAAPWPSLTVVRSDDAGVRSPTTASWRQLTPSMVIEPGSALQGALTLAANDGALPHLSLVGHGQLGDGSLRLSTGTATVQLAAGAVIAGPHRIEAVPGTCLFSVSRVASETVIAVAQGSVDVLSGAERRRLTAPQGLRLTDDGSVAATAVVPPAAPVVLAGPWAWLDGSDLQGIVTVDGDATPISVWPSLVSVGRHRLTIRRDGRTEERLFEASAGLQPLRWPEPSAAELPPDFEQRLKTAVQTQVPTLRACYESWLKTNPHAAGEVVVGLQLASTGAVMTVKLGGTPLPPSVAECLRRTAGRLTLPAPGRPESVELPLVLQPGK